jgi:translocation and assembly module TamA
VRGYAYRSLGPEDDSGTVTGGKQLLSGSIELERELWEHVGLSLFYDAGNAFDSFSSFTLYQGAGITLHYYTPVGSLNLSLARTLNVDNPTYRLHFTLGFDL